MRKTSVNQDDELTEPPARKLDIPLPPNSPASVTLQPAPGDTGKPCGVDYELKTFVADNIDEKPHKRNSVRLAIRKLTYAPEEPAPQPNAEAVKDFIMSPGSIRLEASLDKEKYYHGESIAINVLVDNNTNKTVKKIKISVFQDCELSLYDKSIVNFILMDLEFLDFTAVMIEMSVHFRYGLGKHPVHFFLHLRLP
ncbi:Beta-arrestin-1, partial [Bulinus truncatus]